MAIRSETFFEATAIGCKMLSRRHKDANNLHNFRCPSKIRYGLGPVPGSYYVNPQNAMPDYDQLTTVYAGDKHLIEFKVTAGTRIRLVGCGDLKLALISILASNIAARARVAAARKVQFLAPKMFTSFLFSNIQTKSVVCNVWRRRCRRKLRAFCSHSSSAL